MPDETANNPPPPARSLGLDALRGLAILLMCLSGVVPNWLPNAMYHGYYPRFLPDDDGDWRRVDNPRLFRGDWPGFTWVDWVFPMFLFAMGAAIPLALANRRQRGVPAWRLVLGVAWRWLGLIGFAVYVRQIDPYVIHDSPTTATWLLAIAGFAMLFPVFMRLPRRLSAPWVLVTRLTGIVGCVGMVALYNRGPDQSFAWSQHDIIILLLAHAALFAGLLWLVLPRWPVLRTLVLLPIFFVAHHQAMEPDGRLFRDRLDGVNAWLNQPKQWLDLSWFSRHFNGRVNPDWLNLSPLWDFTWLKFMWIVVPGLAIGDVLVRALNLKEGDGPPLDQPRWGGLRLVLIVALLIPAIVLVFAGVKDHGQVLISLHGFDVVTPYAALMLGGPALILAGLALMKPQAIEDRLLVTLYAWGTAMLVAGLMLNLAPQVQLSPDGQPFAFTVYWDAVFEGGIRKGPPATLAYYLTTSGLSVLALAVLTVLVDRWRWGRKVFALLVLNGQNPMLAYAGIRSLLLPLVKLPLLSPLGLAGVKTLDDYGFLRLPKQIADWRQQAGLVQEPWVKFVWSVVKTLALGIVVMIATRCRLVWRS